MRRRLLTLLLAVVLVTLAVAPAAPAFTRFVRRAGPVLTVGYGGPVYRFDGLNAYGAAGTCGAPYDLDETLTAWQGAGNAIRAWFFQNEVTVNGARDWTRFDRVLASARAHGYRVVATLANQWPDCGEEPKGTAWYQTGYRDKDPRGTVSYRNFVAGVTLRYKNDPTILAWQMMNEAESQDAAALHAWAQDIALVIKSKRANQLISIGTIGTGQPGTAGALYQELHSIRQVDLLEVHDYGQGSVAWPGNLDTALAAARALGKPLFVGESGIFEWVGLDVRAQWFDGKASAAFQNGLVGYLLWHSYPVADPFRVAIGDPALAVLARYVQH